MNASGVLPVEVWLLSLGYLRNTDLKALRLSREPLLRSLASELLFTTAYIASRRGVLDTFTNLTTHPVFRAHVKEIVFDSSFIDPRTVVECTDEKTGAALASLFHEQERIQANELQIRLENAFQCLSKVKTVSYADLSRVSYLPGDRRDPVWDSDYLDGPLIRRIEFDPCLSEFGICCLMNWRNVGCPGHADRFQYRRKFGGLLVLLQVLSDHASTTLRQLRLGSRVHACEDGGVPSWLLWSNLIYDRFHCFPTLFYGLRKFELSVSIFERCEMYSVFEPSTLPRLDYYKGVDLASLLCLAQNLEEIQLIGDPKAPKKWRVTSTLGIHQWARLRVLYLKSFRASSRELEDFLRRHTLSLERMTLDEFHLTSGSWLELGANVPTIAPALEFILGSVSAHKCRQAPIDAFLPLDSSDLDVSGPSRGWYDKAKRAGPAELQVKYEDRDEDEDDSDDEDEVEDADAEESVEMSDGEHGV